MVWKQLSAMGRKAAFWFFAFFWECNLKHKKRKKRNQKKVLQRCALLFAYAKAGRRCLDDMLRLCKSDDEVPDPPATVTNHHQPLE